MKNFLRLVWAHAGLVGSFLVLTAFFSMPHAGFMMIPVVMGTLLYQLVRLGLGWRIPQKRRRHFLAISLLVAASAVVALAQVYHHTRARQQADALLQQVLVFKDQQGRFPQNLAELGAPLLPQRHEYMLHYDFQNGKPVLFYATTFIPFDTWDYDFSGKAWVFVAD